MQVLHFPMLWTDNAGVVIATMRHPDHREGYRLVEAPRCHPLALP